MKILRTVGILALVAGLVLGGAGSAFAQGPPGKRGLFGTVISPVETIAGGYVIHLETEDWGTVDLTINGDAKYMIPRKTKGPVDLGEFETFLDPDITAIVGERIAVLAKNFVGEFPSFTGDAVRLMLIPSPSSPPSHAHRVGIVATFIPGEDGSIEIIDKDGEPHPFALDETTVYRPDDIDMGAITGGFVTVVTKGDPKLGTAIAKVIVLHDELPDWAPEP